MPPGIQPSGAERASTGAARLFRRRILLPVTFGVLIAICYAVALVPALRRAHWDSSVFVDAGDRLVETGAPIIVREHSDGYDGEFYYRLAIDPWPSASAAHGVTFDDPPYRAQRILYPALTWVVSLGHPAYVPKALVAVNLLAIGVIAGASVALRSAARLPFWFPVAIVACPGFVVTLTHDTTELVPQALIMLALWAWARGKFTLFAVFAGLAPLGREVTLLIPAGFLLWSTAAFLQNRNRRSFGRAVVCGVALLPFALWRETLILLFQAGPSANDLGWPGAGFVLTIDRLLRPYLYPGLPQLTDGLGRRMALALAGTAGLVAAVAAYARSALRSDPLGPVLIAWILCAGLISLLRTGGPWIEDIAVYRALTEFYILSVVVLAAAAVSWRVAVPLLAMAILACRLMWIAAINHVI